MSSTAAHEEAEREYVTLMRAKRARAVVLVGSRSDNTAARDALRAEIDAFTRSGGRAACIGRTCWAWTRLLPENRAGAEALAWALAAPGHRRFAVLAGPRSLLTGQDRTNGFRDGLNAWSVSVDPARVVHGDLSRDGGYQSMSEILAAGEPLPDCVFAVSDIMAVGALARLRAAGIDVPGDIALAGFDDILTLARRVPAAHQRCGCRSSGSARSPPGWGSATTPRGSRGSSLSPARSCCGTARGHGRRTRGRPGRRYPADHPR